MMKNIVIIPARLNSTRFPSKILHKINGLPMVEHVRRRALFSKNIDEVFIATGDKEIVNELKKYKANIIFTKQEHDNGTSRITEAVKNIACKNVILVHAVRYSKELTYQKTISELKEMYGERFIYVTYVSREYSENSLDGRIPKSIANGKLEKAADIKMSPQNTHIMLCGNPEMVKDTTVELKKIGLKKHRRNSPGHITTENYW